MAGRSLQKKEKFKVTESNELALHRLGAGDGNVVRWVLYTALSWNGDSDFPPLEVAVQHPDVVRYHEGWGRAGDFGMKALVDDKVAGAAFARLFTDDDHGYGYVDRDTPEFGIGVARDHRGKGIGRRLMLGVAESARRNGFRRLSLSVNNPNPAKRLYESVGYTIVRDEGDSSVMVLDL